MYAIHMVRKPLGESSIVKNVLTHGTGALDIDGARLPNINGPPPLANLDVNSPWEGDSYNEKGRFVFNKAFKKRAVWNPEGKFPTNILLLHKDNCTSVSCALGCPVEALGKKSKDADTFFKNLNAPESRE